jgi:hypothetical protein
MHNWVDLAMTTIQIRRMLDDENQSASRKL